MSNQLMLRNAAFIFVKSNTYFQSAAGKDDWTRSTTWRRAVEPGRRRGARRRGPRTARSRRRGDSWPAGDGGDERGRGRGRVSRRPPRTRRRRGRGREDDLEDPGQRGQASRRGRRGRGAGAARAGDARTMRRAAPRGRMKTRRAAELAGRGPARDGGGGGAGGRAREQGHGWTSI